MKWVPCRKAMSYRVIRSWLLCIILNWTGNFIWEQWVGILVPHLVSNLEAGILGRISPPLLPLSAVPLAHTAIGQREGSLFTVRSALGRACICADEVRNYCSHLIALLSQLSVGLLINESCIQNAGVSALIGTDGNFYGWRKSCGSHFESDLIWKGAWTIYIFYEILGQPYTPCLYSKTQIVCWVSAEKFVQFFVK